MKAIFAKFGSRTRRLYENGWTWWLTPPAATPPKSSRCARCTATASQS